jgi:stage V sporulation protein AE
MNQEAKKVVVITDGDLTARDVVERVAANIGGRCISLSYGNPTDTPVEKIIGAVKSSHGNPVLVMVDDGGKSGCGPGERILAAMADDPAIEIIGAVAVASKTSRVEGAVVEASVDNHGEVVGSAVDKEGNPQATQRVTGDTVDILNKIDIPVVIGVGDLGKMNKADRVAQGAKVTTEAVREILRRAGWQEEHGD